MHRLLAVLTLFAASIAADAAVITRISNDVNQDIEPSTVVQPFEGADRQIVGYIKFTSGTPHVTVQSSIDNGVTQTLAIPSGYQRSADPVLVGNPSSGVNPGRVYCVGTVYQEVSGGFGDNQIRVWTSDDAGRNWSTGQAVAAEPDSSDVLVDKPAAAVSQYPATRGIVYVAFMRVAPPSYISAAMDVYRLNPSTGNFEARTPVFPTADKRHAPQIMVDPNTGHIYAMWIDYGRTRSSVRPAAIHIARSTDEALTWTELPPFTPGTLLENSQDGLWDAALATAVHARSTIAARFNAQDNSVGVVWHQRESPYTNTSNTDIYFNRFSVTASAWTGMQRVNQVTTNDQWHAALAADPAGNYLVAYYDRRDDPADNLYRVYATRISAAGSNLAPDAMVYDPQRRADPRRYNNNFGGINAYSLGEYQDVVYWNGNWYGATTYLPAPDDGGSGDGDIYTYKLSAATLRGDFDGNGYSDLLWRKTNGENRIWLMNGLTVIGSATLPTTAVLAWTVGGVGDMDFDGDQDIVWHNASTGLNAVWFLNQTAYSSSTTFTAGPDLAWHMVSVFDFANDGKYDILWHNDATGATQLWPMNGTSQAGAPIDYQTVADTRWRLAGTGQLRGNGEHDPFWHNSGTDLNAQWFMTGAALTGSTTFSTTPAEWQPSAIGKYDADSFDDVVWRNSNTGAIVIWHMSGSGTVLYTDVVSLSETDLAWSIVGPR